MINTSRSSSSDGLPFKFCSNHKLLHTYDLVTILTCIVNGASSPVAVAGNSLILASIWRNPSLRTPTYTFLGFLALADFFIGLLGQPFYVIYRVADLKGYDKLYCVASAVAHSIVPYLVILTASTLTSMAVERWLVMSRRSSLITVRRVYFIESALLIVPVPYMALRRLPGMDEYFDVPVDSIMEGCMGFCFLAIFTLAYFRVFRIIRHHQQQVHSSASIAGQSVIHFEKYKRSVYSILWIAALFVLSYSPYLLSTVLVKALNVSYETSLIVLHIGTTSMLISSTLNPFLYVWRLRDVRQEAKKVIRKILGKLRILL